MEEGDGLGAKLPNVKAALGAAVASAEVRGDGDGGAAPQHDARALLLLKM